MKTVIKKIAQVSLLAVLFVSNAAAKIQDETAEDSTVLDLQLYVEENDVPLTGAVVKVYLENKVIAVFNNDLLYDITLSLKLNEYYSIEISKPGYVSRLLGVSTKFPDDRDYFLYKYEASVSLFREKEIDNSDNYYLDFPVGIISYNPHKDSFDYSKKYTAHIKKEIDKIRVSDTTVDYATR